MALSSGPGTSSPSPEPAPTPRTARCPRAFRLVDRFPPRGHVHPASPQTGVTSGTFTIPLEGHDFSGDTRYRFTLTVTDSDGLQGSTSVVVFPDKVNLTFGTVPSGLDITVDGIPRPTPFVHDTLIDSTTPSSHRTRAWGRTCTRSPPGPMAPPSST